MLKPLAFSLVQVGIDFCFMKMHCFLIVFVLLGMGTKVNAGPASDSTGMPGDNLDLYAVMDLFKKSDNLEAFEKSINDPNNKINNLDLNKDGQTDYIRVIDHVDSGAHAIVLQVPVNETESQDVAVIEVEQKGVENARIQIVGDEDLYGENYVVEPYESYMSKEEWDAQHNNNTRSQNKTVTTTRVYVNVYTWPCVTYIYRPVYRPWRSPWYWGYYPGWWRPWRPYHWHVYHGYVGHYHGPGYWYRHAPAPHHFHASHRVYHHNRTTSSTYRRSASIINTPNHRPMHKYEQKRNTPAHTRGNQHSGKGSYQKDRSRESGTMQHNNQSRQQHHTQAPRKPAPQGNQPRGNHGGGNRSGGGHRPGGSGQHRGHR